MMQAVILAAGESTRTYPLTITKPKPLLKIANKTIIEQHLELLKGLVTEAIIVVGYKKEMIIQFLGTRYNGIRISYVEQKKRLGTAHAVSLVEPLIKDRFILLMGDDLYSKKDIKNCIKHRYSIMTARVKNPQNFGVILEKNGILVDIIEKPKKFISDRISTAIYSLDKKIFHYIKKIKKSIRNEYEFPDAIRLLSKDEKVQCIKSRGWMPIGYAWDLLKVDSILRKSKILVGRNSKIYGKVKNSTIGENCLIKGYVKDSIIMDNTVIDKDSIVESSVIDENVYFKGKAKAGKRVKSMIKNKTIFAGKLGTIIANDVRAENVNIIPGCKIWPNKRISGLIKKDVE